MLAPVGNTGIWNATSCFPASDRKRGQFLAIAKPFDQGSYETRVLPRLRRWQKKITREYLCHMPKFLVTHLDTQDSLPQEDVTASGVDVVVAWVTGVDHESVHELHGFGTLTTELAGNYNLATLGSALHDETQHTIAGPE